MKWAMERRAAMDSTVRCNARPVDVLGRSGEDRTHAEGGAVTIVEIAGSLVT
jgi:hypothetical protein